MVIFFLLSTLSLTEPGDSLTHLTTHDYILNGAAATIGGITGFAAVFYLTSTALKSTDLGGENFPTEAGLGLGYVVGMPLGTAFYLDFVAKKKGRAGAFKVALKNAEIGALMGIAAVMVAGIVSNETRYWAAMVALPWPIISGVMGYNRSIAMQKNTIQHGDVLMRDSKITLRLWECELR